jgi:hypothetical protein
MTTGEFSREAMAARLGEQVMTDIGRLVAAAPEPSPVTVERLRRIFAPAVAKLTAEQNAASDMAGAA